MTAAGRVRLSLVAVVTLVVQLTWIGGLSVFGVHPDLMLLVAVAAGLVGGPETGAATGFVVGLLIDLFLPTPFGLSALTFTIVGFGVGAARARVLRSAWWIPVVAAVTASAGGEVLYALIGAIVGESHWVTARLGTIAAVVGVANGVFAVLVVPAVAWAIDGRRRVTALAGRW